MYIDPSDPRIKHYQAARQIKKRRAIKRKQITARNPAINRALLERIIDAQLKQEQKIRPF